MFCVCVVSIALIRHTCFCIIFFYFSTSCLKIVYYFVALVLKNYLLRTMFKCCFLAFLGFFLFILVSVGYEVCFGSELGLQCPNYISTLKLRNLSHSLVICFERQVIEGDSDSALRRHIDFSADNKFGEVRKD